MDKSIFKRIATALVALACIALATPTSATIVTATYTGTLRNGSGNLPTFGSASSLRGVGFTTTYVFDTDRGKSSLNVYATAAQELHWGGSGYGYVIDSPLLSASLTINGTTMNFSGGFQDQLLVNRQTDYFQFSQYVSNDVSDVSNNGFIYNNMVDNRSMSIPFDLNTPFSWNVSMGGNSGGEYFRFTNGALDWYIEMVGTSLVVTTSDATPMPEPGTLALLGLALVGLRFSKNRDVGRSARSVESI